MEICVISGIARDDFYSSNWNPLEAMEGRQSTSSVVFLWSFAPIDYTAHPSASISDALTRLRL